jgi:hypothetical protein
MSFPGVLSPGDALPVVFIHDKMIFQREAAILAAT